MEVWNREEDASQSSIHGSRHGYVPNRYRGFITALEKVWMDSGRDLAPESKDSKRIKWMQEQADSLDPFIENPPSILDRKHELGGRPWY